MNDKIIKIEILEADITDRNYRKYLLQFKTSRTEKWFRNKYSNVQKLVCIKIQIVPHEFLKL